MNERLYFTPKWVHSVSHPNIPPPPTHLERKLTSPFCDLKVTEEKQTCDVSSYWVRAFFLHLILSSRGGWREDSVPYGVNRLSQTAFHRVSILYIAWNEQAGPVKVDSLLNLQLSRFQITPRAVLTLRFWSCSFLICSTIKILSPKFGKADKLSVFPASRFCCQRELAKGGGGQILLWTGLNNNDNLKEFLCHGLLEIKCVINNKSSGGRFVSYSQPLKPC